jgi:hypothetical protein
MRLMARTAYLWGTRLVVALILLQVLLAGIGIFAQPEALFWHSAVNSIAVFALPLLLVGVGWYAGIPRRTLAWCAAISGLVILQSILLVPYHLGSQGMLRAVSGLHALNALLIFWVALHVLETGREAALPSGDASPVHL